MSEILKRVEELRETAQKCALSPTDLEYTQGGLGARQYAVAASTNMILMALLELAIYNLTQQEGHVAPRKKYSGSLGYLDWPIESGWYWAIKDHDAAIVYVDGVGEVLTILRVGQARTGKIERVAKWNWYGPLLSPWEEEGDA